MGCDFVLVMRLTRFVFLILGSQLTPCLLKSMDDCVIISFERFGFLAAERWFSRFLAGAIAENLLEETSHKEVQKGGRSVAQRKAFVITVTSTGPLVLRRYEGGIAC